MALREPEHESKVVDIKDFHMANSDPTQTAAADEERDEQRLQEADMLLSQMYFQVRELRLSIPKLVSSLTTQHSSPEALYRQLCDAALSVNTDIKDFRRVMESPEGKKLFEYVSKSRSENAMNITPWRVTEDPNWMKKT